MDIPLQAQPPTLARVHEHEYGVVRIEQRVELFDVLLRLRDRRRRYRVSGHGYRELIPCHVLPGQSCVSVYTRGQREFTYDTGIDLFQSVGCAGGLGFTPLRTVFKLKQGLADGIGE